jgi:thymidylate kinase
LKRQLVVSFDGPKATGKTTVLEATAPCLRAAGHNVVCLCEKELDPFRPVTLELIKELTSNPNLGLEREVCLQLAKGRAWITENVIESQDLGSIVLIDRWYPSDSAFRRILPFPEILQLNLDMGVRIPDLHVGVITAPDISWERAARRARGLNSLVIKNAAEHSACSAAFENAIAKYQWFSCRNELTVQDAVNNVHDGVLRVCADLAIKG